MAFCNLLKHQHHITYDVVKPCCWIKNNSASILDSAAIDEQTRKMSEVTDWIPECNYCKTLENSGLPSPRTTFADNPVFKESTGIVKLEVQIDDDCNAACLMCGTWNSTTWQQYTKKTIKDTAVHFTHKISVNDRFETIKKIVNFDNIRMINFFGGEPLKTNTHLKVLDLIKDPKKVNLVYVTNGSIFPSQEILNIWQTFKDVQISISIDGIDDHFNYLRWPLQWNQVTENLTKYATLDPYKFKINTSFIITPFNILYHDRYKQWAVDFFTGTHIRGDDWFQNPWPVVGTINLECISEKLKQAVLSKYGHDSKVYRLIQPFNEIKYKKFMDYVNTHDQHRSLVWKNTFPEAADLL